MRPLHTLRGGVRLAASASHAIWAQRRRRLAPYLVQVIVAQRADATAMFGTGQRMVCIAHAAQHATAWTPLAWHDLDAIAEAQLPGGIPLFGTPPGSCASAEGGGGGGHQKNQTLSAKSELHGLITAHNK